jgi:hypothetical protein
MYIVEFSEEAGIDADEAGKYYDSQSPFLGLKFIDDIYEASLSIQKNPTAFHYYGNYKTIRRCNLPSFPYSIYYSVTGFKVLFLAIIHQRRSNRYVNRRLK